MRLKLDELQKLVNKTINEEKTSSELKAEIGRVLGPVVVMEGRLSEIVAAANDRLDVLDHTGRTGRLTWEPKITTTWLDHNDPEIRKFATRVCPERHLGRMTNDRNPNVRAAAASRLSLNSIREMIKRFPKDDQLRSIFRKKKLVEVGLPKPEIQAMGHDPVDDKKRLGAVAKTAPGSDLDEVWYREEAQKMVHEYGRGIEIGWEEVAVHRFCSSTKATSGVEIDEAKLLKNVKQIIKEKEDMVLERNALKETLGWLQQQEEQELLAEGVIPDMNEETDPVYELVEGNLTGEQFLSAASKLFKIQEGMLPLGIRKYRLGEGNARQTVIPVIGVLPHRQGFRAVDERALDMFCEHWTKRQQLNGEPLRLEWTNHPTDMNKIGFTCVLK